MHGELTVKIGNTDRKVLLQEGYFDFNVIPSPLHRHNYTELHITESGRVCYSIEEAAWEVAAGTALAIPANTFHSCRDFAPDTRHIAFQVELPVAAVAAAAFPRELLAAFFAEIETALHTGNYAGVAAYISLVCTRFFPEETLPCRPMQDDAFVIREFFSNRYDREVTLKDLARELCRSEKQAERLVVKYTGHTFKKELTAQRLKIARHMMAAGMPPAQAAEYVGYRTYSGFWKACQKEKEIT